MPRAPESYRKLAGKCPGAAQKLPKNIFPIGYALGVCRGIKKWGGASLGKNLGSMICRGMCRGGLRRGLQNGGRAGMRGDLAEAPGWLLLLAVHAYTICRGICRAYIYAHFKRFASHMPWHLLCAIYRV